MDVATTIEQVQDAVRQRQRVRVAGGGSKPALSTGADLSLRELAGVLEYEPSEFTFTARAGTPISTLQTMLAARGQYLPFDPPLAEAGASLGGTVAAALSGPGRFRYGGVRDFLLGVRLVNGDGDLIRGGAKVVKNAAGFDLPKLLVGSQGQFGIMVELSCKVFPLPEAWATLAVRLPDLNAALETMTRLAVAPFELTCLDLEPSARLWLRLGGLRESLPRRIERLRSFLATDRSMGFEQIAEDDEHRMWRDAREFAWMEPDHGLVKVPLVIRQIPMLEQALSTRSLPVARRYSVGGNVAWLAWPQQLATRQLEGLLAELGLSGVALTGTWSQPLLGRPPGQPFAQRLLRVFDPQGKFQRPGLSTA